MAAFSYKIIALPVQTDIYRIHEETFCRGRTQEQNIPISSNNEENIFLATLITEWVFTAGGD
jgi:hypothetical protein